MLNITIADFSRIPTSRECKKWKNSNGNWRILSGRIKQKRNVEIIVINFADSEHEGMEEIIKIRDVIYGVYEEKVRSLSRKSREAFYFTNCMKCMSEIFAPLLSS